MVAPSFFTMPFKQMRGRQRVIFGSVVVKMNCPVSLEPFKHPRVMECGHTIDCESLNRLASDECPVCRAPFERPVPTNWCVVEMMGIDVKERMVSDHVKLTRTIEKMRKIHRQKVEKLVTATIPHVMNKMAKVSASTGKRNMYLYSSFIKNAPGRHIRNEAFERLVGRLRGLGISTSYTDTPLFWCCFGDRMVILKW